MSKLNVANFLKELAEKAGIDENNEKLIDLLAHTELNKIELPVEITRPINQNLLSIEDAKNNHPKVKTHYFAEIMSNVDRSLLKLYELLGLEDELVEELNTEKSSTKRIALLGEKLKTVMEAKGAAGEGKASKNEATLKAKVDELNEQLRVEKEARKKEGDAHKTELNNFKISTAVTGKVGGLKTIYDNLPSDVRVTTLNTLLNKELQDNEAVLVLNEDGSLKLQKKDGTNYFDENNRQVSVDDFINKSLAKHKILQQSPAAPAAAANNNGAGETQNNGQATNVNAGQQGKKVDASALFGESMSGLETDTSPKMI